MTQYNYVHYNILLAHLMVTPGFRARALKHLKTPYFGHPAVRSNGGEVYHGLVFDIIATYVAAFGTAPDPVSLQAECEKMLQRFNNEINHDAFRAQIAAFISWLPYTNSNSIKQADEVLTYIIDNCVLIEAERALFDQARQERINSELIQSMTNLCQQRASLTGGAVQRNLADIDLAAMDSAERVQTGIKFIDETLGGGKGPVDSCVIGIIAGQGSGKTTLGIQACAEKALAGIPALLVLVEEGLTPRMHRSIRSAVLGIPTTVQEECRDQLPIAAAQAGLEWSTVEKKIKLMNEFLEVRDFCKTPGGIDALEGEIERMVSEGRKPKTVYVDWAGQWANYLIANPPSGMKFQGQIDSLKYMSQQLSSIAARVGTQIWISHQMAPAEYKKGPFQNNDHYCAADCRGFTEPFQYVIVINQKDPKTNLQLALFPKARGDVSGQTVVVRHRGAISSFETAVGWAKQNRTFVQKTSAAKQHELPSEGKGARNSSKVEA